MSDYDPADEPPGPGKTLARGVVVAVLGFMAGAIVSHLLFGWP